MRVLLGFNNGIENFEEKVAESLRAENLTIDRIELCSTKSGIANYVSCHKNDLDLILLDESVESAYPYKVKEVERLQAINEDILIFLIVQDSHYGDSFMVQLFSNGILNAIYQKDADFETFAKLIVNRRTRRNAKAYYGITNSSLLGNQPEEMLSKPTTEKKDMSKGEDDKSSNVLYVDATQPNFNFTNKEIISVISEEPALSARLSLSIAKTMVRESHLSPSYIQLPYKYQDFEQDAWHTLDFKGLFSNGFIPHMQYVSKNLSMPREQNIINGVSVYCNNSDVDDIENWGIGESYKVIYNAPNPSILDIGPQYNNEDVCGIIRDSTYIIVIVPYASAITGYIERLKSKIKLSNKKQIIAVVKKAPNIELVSTDVYQELQFNELFDEVFDISGPSRYKEPLCKILERTNYMSQNVEQTIQKKKSFLSQIMKKKESVKLNRFVEIAVGATQSGIGCTHDTIMMANVLSKQYRVALVELNSSGCFECLAGNVKGKISQFADIVTFRMKSIDCFYNCTREQFLSKFKKIYDIVIYDCGHEYEPKAYIGADLKILVLPSGVWNYDKVASYMSGIKNIDVDNEVVCCVSGIDARILKDYRILCGKRPLYSIPYSSDPLNSTGDVENVFSNMIKLHGV